MQAFAEAHRRAGRRLALVPTMGALHEGHLALVAEAARRADVVVVSVFVNPTQFGPGEDLARYPRDLDGDAALLSAQGLAAALFAPSEAALYPGGAGSNRTWVTVEGLDAHLCGAFRPGHFRGVTTVVARLLLLCKPHVAVFGLKDAQQYVILRRMVRDLHFDVEMVGVPTVREADGLARSSRNVYLTPAQRQQAVVLSQALEAARSRLRAGELRPSALVVAMLETLATAPEARVQYAEVVDAETLQPVEVARPGQPLLVAVAAFFGTTRLIDSLFVAAPEAGAHVFRP